MIRKNEELDLAISRRCPKCYGSKLKDWEELSDDQKMLVDRLPGSAIFGVQDRKMHRFLYPMLV